MKALVILVPLITLSIHLLGQQKAASGISRSEASLFRLDTTYFETGEIETVTRELILKPTLYSVKQIKTVYQYDLCGNLRNTTKIYEDDQPIPYELMGTTRKRKYLDTIVIGVNCNTQWVKPLFY